jgi:hypothetical protein
MERMYLQEARWVVTAVTASGAAISEGCP